MKTAVVVKQDHPESGLLKKAIIHVYDGEPNPSAELPFLFDGLVVEHVQVPAELENEKYILADIDENNVVSLRLPHPGEIPFPK